MGLFYGTAACRPIVPLPPMGSPHSSPEAPRTTYARETSASEGGNYTRNFASTFVIHRGTRFFYMRAKLGHETDSFTSPPNGRHADNFSDARKIQWLRPGLNPRTRVPEAKHANHYTTGAVKQESLARAYRNEWDRTRRCQMGGLCAAVSSDTGVTKEPATTKNTGYW